MSYTGPGSVVNLCDEFITHWQAVNAAQAPGAITVVPEGGAVAKTRADLLALRGTYFAVQSAPGTAAVYSPRRRVRENPFEDETTARDDGDDDLMIEAELRELGGRIAGSVLDS